MNDTSQPSETFSDRLLGASIPARDARLRMVRLEQPLAEILAAHDYPPAMRNLLAEALVVTALIGGLIDEEEGQLTIQAQTSKGIVRLLVCDYRDGDLNLLCGPAYHAGPLTFDLAFPIASGIPILLMEKFNAAQVLALIERHRV